MWKTRKNMEKILFVDAFGTGKSLALYAKNMGIDVYHLTSNAISKFPLTKEELKQYLEMQLGNFYTHIYEYHDNMDELLPVFEKANFDAIIPGSETGVELAEWIATKLHLPTNDIRYIDTRRNKYSMQARLKECGLRYIDTIKIDNERDLLDWYHKNTYDKVILKPVQGAGSENTFVNFSEQELLENFRKIKNTQNFYGDVNTEILAQEYIEGTGEYVINCVSCNSVHKISEIICYNRVVANNQILYDIEYLVPKIDAKIQAAIDYILKVLDAFGIQNGVTHNELKIDEKGPVLIETGARVMGHLPGKKSLEEALGHSPLKLIIDSYIDKKAFTEFLDIRQGNLPRKFWLSKTFIFKQEGEIEKITAYDTLSLLKNIREIEFDLALLSKKIEKTKDLITASSSCILVADSKNELMNAYKTVKYIEQCEPGLLYKIKGKSSTDKEHILLEKLKKGDLLANEYDQIFGEKTLELDEIQIIEFFRKNVLLHPEKTAIKNPIENHVESITYKELDEYSDYLASFIVNNDQIKFQPGDIIACLNKDAINYGIEDLTALKIGGVILNLYHKMPNDRLRQSLKAASAKVLISDYDVSDITNGLSIYSIQYHTDKMLHKNSANCAASVSLDQQQQELFINAKERFHFTKTGKDYTYSRDSICAIFFTSGSTGSPKGVETRYGSLQNILYDILDMKENIFYKPNSVSASLSNPGIIAFFLNLMQTFLFGAQTVTIPLTVLQNMKALEAYIDQFQISDIYIPAAFLELYIKYCHNKSVKRITTAGEKIHLSTISKDYDIFGLYGATETLGNLAYNKLNNTENCKYIGDVFKNNHIYILNEDQSVCEEGETGELYITGIQLANRYINAPEANLRFMPNPFYNCVFDDESFSEMLKIGDLAVRHKNGIEILGRSDSQVKIRGMRVDIGDIESQMIKHPQIERCAVIGKENTYQQIDLIAFYTTRDKDNDMDTGSLKTFLKKTVPDYMIPKYFIKKDNLIYNASGKIDRKNLEKIDIRTLTVHLAEAEKQVDQFQNKTEIQKKISKIWAEILEIDDAYIGSNCFFEDLGGDSFKYTLLVNKISTAFHVDISVKDIGRLKTISSTEQVIEENSKLGFQDYKKEIRDVYPLTQSTLKILFECINHQDTSYNNPIKIRLSRNANIQQLERAFQKVIDSQEILHSCFTKQDSKIYLRVLENRDFHLRIKEMDEAQIQSYEKDFIQPFALFDQLMWRCELIKVTGPEPYYTLFLDFHHAIIDGYSIYIFMNSLLQAYQGTVFSTPKIEISQCGIIEEKSNKDIKYREEAEKYWESAVKDESFINPSIQVLKDIQTNANAANIKEYAINTELVKKVHDLASSYHTTPYVIYLSCFQLLVCFYSNKKDIVLASPFSFRTYGYSNTMGMFAKTLPLYLSANPSDAFEHIVRRNHEVVQSSLQFMNYNPENIILKKSKSIQSLSKDLYKNMFAYMKDYETPQNELFDTFERTPLTEAKFELLFYVYDNEQGHDARFSIEYLEKRFPAEFIDQIARHYHHILDQITQDPEKNIREYPILTKQEKDDILHQFSMPALQLPQTKDVWINHFKNAVQKYPDHIAVVYEYDGIGHQTQEICYKELDAISTKISYIFRKQGVRKGDKLCFMLEPTHYCIILALAAAKIGAVFFYVNTNKAANDLEYLLTSNQCSYMIYENTAAPTFNGVDICKISLSDLIDQYQTADLIEPISVQETIAPSDPFMLLYTSGSTGKPKSFQVSNYGFVSESFSEIACNELRQNTRVGVSANLAFDMFPISAFPPLLCGARIYIMGKISKNLSLIDEYLKRYRIDVTFMTTQLGELYMKSYQNDDLKKLIVAGEQLRYCKKAAYDLINAYGPAEAGIVSRHIVKETSNIPIGKPTGEMRIYILNDHLEVCPLGVKGEIYISGPQVTQGYTNQPQANERFFIENPFFDSDTDEHCYKKMYRSGDLGLWLPGGDILFCGRKDAQVKIDGVRIEPSAIEHIILRFPGIDQAAVVPYRNENGRYYIIGYITTNDKDFQMEKLKDHLRRHLDRYMIPKQIVVMDKMPVNDNGKIQTTKLPKPSLNESIEPITSEEEKTIAEFYSKILNIDSSKIGANTNFFFAGGSSIGTIGLIQMINKKYHLNLNPDFIFTYPEIKQQANYIKTHTISKKHVYTFAQGNPKRTKLIFVHTANTGAESYIPLAQRLDPQIPFYALEQYNLFADEDAKIRGIDQLANQYLKFIKTELGDEPYSLGGWSYGALIAYEMACILEKNNKQPKNLYLLDPRIIRNKQQKDAYQKASDRNYFVRYLEKEPLFAEYLKLGLIDKMVENNKEITKDIIHFTPKKYAGEVCLFKSTMNHAHTYSHRLQDDTGLSVFDNEKYNGFDAYADHITLITIDTDHDSFMKPHYVEKIADVINQKESE